MERPYSKFVTAYDVKNLFVSSRIKCTYFLHIFIIYLFRFIDQNHDYKMPICLKEYILCMLLHALSGLERLITRTKSTSIVCYMIFINFWLLPARDCDWNFYCMLTWLLPWQFILVVMDIKPGDCFLNEIDVLSFYKPILGNCKKGEISRVIYFSFRFEKKKIFLKKISHY